jgi:hypothetical protein
VHDKYDVLLTHCGDDPLATAFVMMNIIQQISPVPLLNISDVRLWLTHTPVLVRRGINQESARLVQERFEAIGASVVIIPSELLFPQDTMGISQWCNEWFSEHLVALHETGLAYWAQDVEADEVYRFSYLPSIGMDVTIRLWREGNRYYGSVRRSMGSIGPLPGPPAYDVQWTATQEDWQALNSSIQAHHFWNSKSWDTVPDGYVVLDSVHWVVEGWRKKQYHVLFDQTPDEGAAREVGLLLLGLLPDEFTRFEMG